MARKVIWSRTAIGDLGAIVRYVAADNRSAALALGHAIFERTRVLMEFSHSGRVVREIDNPNVRELILEPYRIIYEINANGETIDIVRVWHAARGQPKL
jgi:toxin ParE1/3/4